MKPLFALLMPLFLIGCATSELFDPKTGRRTARFQGDITNMSYEGHGVKWTADQVSHSSATLAGGQAFSQGTTAVGSAGGNVLLSAGSSGIFPRAAAVVAAPAITSAVNQSPRR